LISFRERQAWFRFLLSFSFSVFFHRGLPFSTLIRRDARFSFGVFLFFFPFLPLRHFVSPLFFFFLLSIPVHVRLLFSSAEAQARESVSFFLFSLGRTYPPLISPPFFFFSFSSARRRARSLFDGRSRSSCQFIGTFFSFLRGAAPSTSLSFLPREIDSFLTGAYSSWRYGHRRFRLGARQTSLSLFLSQIGETTFFRVPR